MDSPRFSLPRRHAIGFGVASLAFARTGFAQGTDAFQPLPAKISVTANHLTTPVMINGKGPFRFVVDTGADCSVMAGEVAAALQISGGSEVVVQGIVRAIPARSVAVNELRFGTVVRDGLQMPILPRAMLQADGYLGLDAIGAHRVTFDFKNGTLEVREGPPGTFIERSGSGETRIAAPGFGGHLRATACRVDKMPAVAFIDSGAEVTVGNRALHQKLLYQDSLGYAGTRDVELSGITGGSCKGRVVRVQAIQFGDIEFSGCEIAIADLDVFRIWDLMDKPALLVGLNFLRQFQLVIIDYRRKEFRLKLASNGWVSRRPA